MGGGPCPVGTVSPGLTKVGFGARKRLKEGAGPALACTPRTVDPLEAEFPGSERPTEPSKASGHAFRQHEHAMARFGTTAFRSMGDSGKYRRVKLPSHSPRPRFAVAGSSKHSGPHAAAVLAFGSLPRRVAGVQTCGFFSSSCSLPCHGGLSPSHTKLSWSSSTDRPRAVPPEPLD